MAQLKLFELHPAGSELFQDSESFLEELSDRELDFVAGGMGGNSPITVVVSLSNSIFTSVPPSTSVPSNTNKPFTIV